MNTVRLKPELRDKVQALARQRGVSVSEIHRRALEEYVRQEMNGTESMPVSESASRYDDIIGVADGPVDGSVRVTEYFVEGLIKRYGGNTR